jgi:hypothetical protein
MVLCDFNMITILNLISYLNHNPNDKLSIDLVRYVTLNSIRSYNKQFRDKYGDLILCCDSATYWRRDIFPYYKSGRKKSREKSSVDWKFIFDNLDTLRSEFKNNLRYKVIMVDGAEADDLIAVLTKKFYQQEPILILSSDKDFVQLQKYPNVKQFNPLYKRFISVADPIAFTKEHIIRGDSGDGIPNFLSADDVFVVGERQKSINTNKLTEWMTLPESVFCTTDTMLRGFKRNQQLIDFDFIPEELSNRILTEFIETKPVSRVAMMRYFMEKKLETLVASLDEF